MPDGLNLRYEELYSQRRDKKASAIESWLLQQLSWMSARYTSRNATLKKFVSLVDTHGQRQDQITPLVLDELRSIARRDGMSEDYVARVFAFVRQTSEELLGLRHFDVQLIGGWAMLHGMVAEMETGQGKTLTATLAASAAALAGFPTHIITVNEYLAERDADTMRPLYEALGLTVSVVLAAMQEDEKRVAYQADVVYCTNKQVAFDYLRDRIQAGDKYSSRQLQMDELYNDQPIVNRLLLTGLHFAIVDEADSVLIDEAVTPLVISTEVTNNSKKHAYKKALKLAEGFIDNEDYVLHEHVGMVEFRPKGLEKLSDLGEELGGLFNSSVIREELVAQAIRALHLYVRDHQYLVIDGSVQIIDEFTGRLMPDRNWEGGLHQMIELKEGCEMTGDKETLARISYQRFFRRYQALSGMTGTGSEVRKEILKVYDMYVFKIPPAQTIQRKIAHDHVSLTQEDKWQAVIENITEVHESGRPVLIGTRSVENSEHLSQLLSQANISHEVLNARQDKAEADMISRAGQAGSILVATNMAGRGTDIKLSEEVKTIGGLHVIMTERHDSHRIDRQLFGRCGRQGDPGSVQTFVALDDDLVRINMSSIAMNIFTRISNKDSSLSRVFARGLVVFSQKVVERRHYVTRNNVLKMDEQFGNLMAFSGRME